MPIAEGWAKVGRSGCADIRLDDPTVSRRHALVVRTEDGQAEGARRPQPERPLRQRRARRVDGPRRRRRARDRALQALRLLSLRGQTPHTTFTSPARAAPICCASRGDHDLDPLPEGRHRQDDDDPHARGRLRPSGARRPRDRRRPAGQPLRLLRHGPRRRADPGRRDHGPGPGGRRRSTDRWFPRTSGSPRPSSRLAGKIGREVTLRNALRDLKRERDVILIDCPPTLGPPDRERAGGIRLRDALDAGAVLLASGRRAGDGGREPRQGQPQSRPRAARDRPQHREHAHQARAPHARVASRAISATRSFAR